MDDISQFRELFLKTAGEHIAELNRLIIKKKTDTGSDLLNEIHLHLHSLKGEVLVMRYLALGKYITILENYLKNAKDSHLQLPGVKVAILEDAIAEVAYALNVIKLEGTEPLDLDEKSSILSENLVIRI